MSLYIYYCGIWKQFTSVKTINRFMKIIRSQKSVNNYCSRIIRDLIRKVTLIIAGLSVLFSLINFRSKIQGDIYIYIYKLYVQCWRWLMLIKITFLSSLLLASFQFFFLITKNGIRSRSYWKNPWSTSHLANEPACRSNRSNASVLVAAPLLLEFPCCMAAGCSPVTSNKSDFKLSYKLYKSFIYPI